VNSLLTETKAEAVLWGDIVQQKEEVFFHLTWTAKAIGDTNHPSGRFQPGKEISLPPLQENDLSALVGMIVETRRLELNASKNSNALKHSITEIRSLATTRRWNDEEVAQLGYLLGYALEVTGWQEKNSALLNEAGLIYQELAQQHTREHNPHLWAEIQNNLGFAYLALGIQEPGKEHLEAALDAYRNALWERNREKTPLSWAAALNNYGYALTTLAEREEASASVSLLEEAIDIFAEALSVYTPQDRPQEWEMVQGHLDRAQQRLEERRSSCEYSDGGIFSECIAGGSHSSLDEDKDEDAARRTPSGNR
jgi:tetratricopeptide (TPR) repeat protein